MNKKLIVVPIIVVCFVGCYLLFPKQTESIQITICQINENPEQFIGKEVNVTGFGTRVGLQTYVLNWGGCQIDAVGNVTVVGGRVLNFVGKLESYNNSIFLNIEKMID